MVPGFPYGIYLSLMVENPHKRVLVFLRVVTDSGKPVSFSTIEALTLVFKMVPDESGLFRYCVPVPNQRSCHPHS